MSREKLATQIRQEQIAQAALSLIASHGVKGLSVAAVAQRVGLVPSGIYRHFRSKDQILDAALDFIAERLLGNVRIVSAESVDALERLQRLLMRHVELLRQNQGVLRVMFAEEAYSGRPARKAKVFRMIQTYLAEIGAIIRDGQRQRRIRADVEPGSAALMFLGLIQPAAILWQMSDGQFDVTRHTDKAWTVFRAGLMPR